MGLISTAIRFVAGRSEGKRAVVRHGNQSSEFDPDLECFLLQMSVLTDVRMKQRAQELSALGFERRQMGYETAERQFDYTLRCHQVAPDMRQQWLGALMYALRCEVERQDLSDLMKRGAASSLIATSANAAHA